ncbi:MAG: hypothetical protein JWP24_2129 [Marmoricola sp.]|nr:hypothetical protein [Marmoricola sp.]
MAGEDVSRLYRGEVEVEFDGAVGDPEMVAEAYARWREEIAFAQRYVDRTPDLGTVAAKDDVLREMLLRMIDVRATRTTCASASRRGWASGRATRTAGDNG